MKKQNHFTIAIDCCEHEKFIEKCLSTCLTQRYDNFSVLLVDACSTDNSFKIAQEYAKDFKNLKVYQNEVRLPQVANFMWLTDLSEPNTILAFVDSDDYLPHSKVLQRLNDEYNSGDVLCTYGSYLEDIGNGQPLRSVSWNYQAYPENIIKNNDFRNFKWLGTHLKSYRRELLLKINRDDLKFESGDWLDTTGDLAMAFPCLEMSFNRSRYISDTTYIYCLFNENRDSAHNTARQLELEKYIRSKKKYQPLTSLD